MQPGRKMPGPWAPTVLVSLALLGCSGPASFPRADGGTTDDGPPDAGPNAACLTVEFRLGDPLPAEEGGVEITAVRLDLQDFKLLSDVTPSNPPPETTRSKIDLDWTGTGENTTDVKSQSFCAAPAALYQAFDTSVTRYRFQGSVDSDPFDIDVEGVDISISETLDVPVDYDRITSATIEIDIDVDDVIDGIDGIKGDLPDDGNVDSGSDGDLLDDLEDVVETAF